MKMIQWLEGCEHSKAGAGLMGRVAQKTMRTVAAVIKLGRRVPLLA